MGNIRSGIRNGGSSLAACLLALASGGAAAGIFDDPQNLEVLARDITPAELRATMKGFAFATGARCETCHVGEAGMPLTTFDFAADDKDMKKKARLMLRMVADINASFADRLGKDSAGIVQVECVTCHRGQRRPLQLADDLAETFASDGLTAALARYAALKQQYYGSHTFDFSEWSIIALAERLAGEGESEAALAFLDLNLETNPESITSLIMSSQLQARSGNATAARESLERALQIEPGNAFIRSQLEQLAAD